MMKKLLALLLALSLPLILLACSKPDEPAETPEVQEPAPVPEPVPEPEPEPEPVDPRTLWDTAAELVGDYVSKEIQNRSESVMVVDGEEQVQRNTTMIRANNLNNGLTRYEVITTGDNPSELYYADSFVYTDDGQYQYCCMMANYDLEKYIEEQSIPVRQTCFETVELISEENGYEIAFSDPTEEFYAIMKDRISTAGTTLKDDTVTFSGTIVLDEEGHFKTVSGNLSCTLVLYGTMEVPMTQTVNQRYLSHDKDVTIELPAKLAYHTEVNDIRVADLMNEGFTNHAISYAADYAERLSFTGSYAGTEHELQFEGDVIFRFDPFTRDIQYHASYDNTVTYAAGTEEWIEELDYADGILEIRVDEESIQEDSIDSETMIAAAMANYCSFASGDMGLYYLNFKDEHRDGDCIISFTPGDIIGFSLYAYVVEMLDPENFLEVYSATDYKLQRRSNGVLVIEEETSRIKSITFNLEATFTLPDGTVLEGVLTYEQVFHAANEDVVFEPGTGVAQGA